MSVALTEPNRWPCSLARRSSVTSTPSSFLMSCGLLLALLGLEPLDLLAAGLDLLDVVRRRLDGQVLGQQVVPGVTGRDLDDVADPADVLDGFFQQKFYGCHDQSSEC